MIVHSTYLYFAEHSKENVFWEKVNLQYLYFSCYSSFVLFSRQPRTLGLTYCANFAESVRAAMRRGLGRAARGGWVAVTGNVVPTKLRNMRHPHRGTWLGDS